MALGLTLATCGGRREAARAAPAPEPPAPRATPAVPRTAAHAPEAADVGAGPAARGPVAPAALVVQRGGEFEGALGPVGRGPSAPAALVVPLEFPPPAEFGSEEAEQILFPDEPQAAAQAAEACPRRGPEPARVRCLIQRRFADDPAASALASDLFGRWGHVPGVERPHLFEGGYRGRIRVVAARPVEAERRHLEWIAGALEDIDDVLTALARASKGALRYRWRALALRFFRTPSAATPSAFARGWTVSYNLAGALNTSRGAVRETLFHEIFHLNDAFHGGFSLTHLAALQDALRARCRAPAGQWERMTSCLTPYAPNFTVVRGGTYYAFQPTNDAQEYGAELAIRYFREQRAALRGTPLAEPAFKCGPQENGAAWGLLVREFFGGVDLTPPCGQGT